VVEEEFGHGASLAWIRDAGDAATLAFHKFLDIFPETDQTMTAAQKKALAAHRRRQKRRGFTRLEIKVRKADAALIRGVARALADPARETRARAALRREFGGGAMGLKALLVAAPLEGIDLARERDLGRDVAL
jgi:hypothetical protein